MLNETIANHYLFLAIFFGFNIFYSNLLDANHICWTFYRQKKFSRSNNSDIFTHNHETIIRTEKTINTSGIEAALRRSFSK